MLLIVPPPCFRLRARSSSPSFLLAWPSAVVFWLKPSWHNAPTAIVDHQRRRCAGVLPLCSGHTPSGFAAPRRGRCVGHRAALLTTRTSRIQLRIWHMCRVVGFIGAPCVDAPQPRVTVRPSSTTGDSVPELCSPPVLSFARRPRPHPLPVFVRPHVLSHSTGDTLRYVRTFDVIEADTNVTEPSWYEWGAIPRNRSVTPGFMAAVLVSYFTGYRCVVEAQNPMGINGSHRLGSSFCESASVWLRQYTCCMCGDR